MKGWGLPCSVKCVKAKELFKVWRNSKKFKGSIAVID